MHRLILIFPHDFLPDLTVFVDGSTHRILHMPHLARNLL